MSNFLGSIVSDVTKVVTDPGALVSDAAKAILPKNMAAVGDLLGGITDIESGHPLQALSHINDAIKDLPQLLQSLAGTASGAPGASKPAGTAAAEPTPPPTTATSTPATTTPATTTTSTTTSAPATTTATSAPATAATSSPAAPAAVPTSPHAPSVVATKDTVRIDDGTKTTTVMQFAGRSQVVVRDDATGKPLSNSFVSGSNVSIDAAGEHITVIKNGAETFTRVNNGTNATTVDQTGNRTTIATTSDAARTSVPAAYIPASTRATTAAAPAAASTPAGTSGTTTASTPATTPALPGPGLATTVAALFKALAGGAGTTAPAPTGGSTAASGSGATVSSATGTPASSVASTGTASTPAATSGASSSTSSSATPADLQSLMALSPDQFMQAVTSGKIPDDVANSQSAMMQVQARMNQITQMNQLVTGMMAAMHQMEMSIIQNIRC